MAFFDLSREDLDSYNPHIPEAGDFEDFWLQTLGDEFKAHRKKVKMTRVLEDFPAIEAYDLEFSGFGGHPIKAWFILPAKKLRSSNSIPCILEFIGYGGGRGFPQQWLLWPAQGYGIFVMDTRGQGSVWQKGETPDPELEVSNPQSPGFMTRGILSPWHYYYRRVFTDGVLAFYTLCQLKGIDPEKIILNGGSQGGGIGLAVNGILHMLAANPKADYEKRVPAGLIADVPFLCHYKRACTVTDSYPYQEIAQYLRVHQDQEDMVFAALSYFDGANFASRCTNPALFSTSLMDPVCPPSTVFAAYNRYKGSKSITVYTFNGHEGGGARQENEKFAFTRKIFLENNLTSKA